MKEKKEKNKKFRWVKFLIIGIIVVAVVGVAASYLTAYYINDKNQKYELAKTTSYNEILESINIEFLLLDETEIEVEEIETLEETDVETVEQDENLEETDEEIVVEEKVLQQRRHSLELLKAEEREVNVFEYGSDSVCFEELVVNVSPLEATVSAKIVEVDEVVDELESHEGFTSISEVSIDTKEVKEFAVIYSVNVYDEEYEQDVSKNYVKYYKVEDTQCPVVSVEAHWFEQKAKEQADFDWASLVTEAYDPVDGDLVFNPDWEYGDEAVLGTYHLESEVELGYNGDFMILVVATDNNGNQSYTGYSVTVKGGKNATEQEKANWIQNRKNQDVIDTLEETLMNDAEEKPTSSPTTNKGTKTEAEKEAERLAKLEAEEAAKKAAEESARKAAEAAAKKAAEEAARKAAEEAAKKAAEEAQKAAEQEVRDAVTNGTYANQVLAKVNEERSKEGLSALTMDSTMQAYAQQRATEIITMFSHTRPSGASCFEWDNTDSYSTQGENIAAGQRTPTEVMNGWMNSSGHKSNILNSDYTNIGIGVAQDSNGMIYWVQFFGKPW